jgi:hypothetical protein
VVNASTPGSYQIQLYVYAVQGGTDSVWVQLNQTTLINFTTFPSNPATGWRTVTTTSLTAGLHTIRLWRREPMGLGGIRVIV